jgi:NADH dehydrogenase
MSKQRVIIIGGGFGGVTLAQHLERKLPSEIEIVLISGENHLVFTPLLAEVVGRSISPLHVVVAGRQMVRRTTWLTAQVSDIDLQSNLVRYVSASGASTSLTYDHLVLACGSVVNMNLIPGLAAYAYPLKTLGDAIYLGNDLITRFEAAAVETDTARRKRLLDVVVIGFAASGVRRRDIHYAQAGSRPFSCSSVSRQSACVSAFWASPEYNRTGVRWLTSRSCRQSSTPS